jgi:hypothetical protein
MLNGKGWQITLTFFYNAIRSIDYKVACLHSWQIASVKFVDDYGEALPERANGSQFLPDTALLNFNALNLVEHTGMSYKEIQNLLYVDFIELSLLVRAKLWQAPTKTLADKRNEEHQRRLRRF